MNDQDTVETKKGFLQNDRLLVCSMLVFYGICILGLIGGTFMWLGNQAKTQAASATATGVAIVTEQANATATVVARATEQAQYDIVDPFKDNHQYWMTTSIDDEYMVGSIGINGGVYSWNINEVKQPFVYWANFRQGSWYENFDVYVDSKIINETPDSACSGFVFRTASPDWEDGAYTFSVCNDSYFDASYYNNGEWESLIEKTYSNVILSDDWNRVGISARGDHFIFTINNVIVSEITNGFLKSGGIALLIEVSETVPVTIWFDNFGLQRR